MAIEWSRKMSYLSYNVLKLDETVSLSPFAQLRKGGQTHNYSKSAVRALQVIELLAMAKCPLRAVEIAAPLGLSPSSANQLLKSLIDSAFLIFDPVTKCYFPSARVAAFGGWLADEYFGDGAIKGLLDTICSDNGRPVYLATSQGAFMQLLDCAAPTPCKPAEGPLAKQFTKEMAVGMRVPIFGSSIGAAWLATQSDERVLAIARLCKRELGTRVDEPDYLLENIRRARQLGHAFGGIVADDTTRAIAVALPPTPSGIVMVVAISGATPDIENRRNEIVQLVLVRINQFLKQAGRAVGDGSVTR